MARSARITALLGETPARQDEDDPTTTLILDAALAEFQSFGLRRATVEDITRRAKVGRMTLHRRFASKQALIEGVFLREIRLILVDVIAEFEEHDSLVDKLAEGLGYGIRAVHDHPLFSRLLETDGEAVLPYLTVEGDSLMVAATEFVAQQIRADTSGGLAPQHADYAGEAILRMCHSILLTPQGRFDFSDEVELSEFLRAAIAPLLVVDR